jgi:hypothetical protein
MKSVKKGFDLGTQDVTNLINKGMDIYNNHIDLQKEMQKTQQVLADSSVRVVESDNRLKEKIAEFNKNIKEIETNYELELAKINNEHELKVRQMDLIEKLIGEIDSIKVEIKIYQSKEGLTSSAVMELFNQIHNEKLTYMNKLISLGQK